MKSFGKFLLGFLIGGFISSLLVLLLPPLPARPSATGFRNISTC